MNNKQLTELFQKIGEKDVQYKRARLIVLQNASQGNIWLIGGFFSILSSANLGSRPGKCNTGKMGLPI